MESLRDEIYTLEWALLQPDVRRSAGRLEALLADDFREFGASGRVYGKADILRALPAESPAAYEIREFEVGPLCDGVVLATYRVVRTSGGMAAVSLRSSIWKKVGGQAADAEQPGEFLQHVLMRYSPLHTSHQALPSVLVDDIQDAERRPIVRAVLHEVVTPDGNRATACIILLFTPHSHAISRCGKRLLR